MRALLGENLGFAATRGNVHIDAERDVMAWTSGAKDAAVVPAVSSFWWPLPYRRALAQKPAEEREKSRLLRGP